MSDRRSSLVIALISWFLCAVIVLIAMASHCHAQCGPYGCAPQSYGGYGYSQPYFQQPAYGYGNGGQAYGYPFSPGGQYSQVSTSTSIPPPGVIGFPNTALPYISGQAGLGQPFQPMGSTVFAPPVYGDAFSALCGEVQGLRYEVRQLRYAISSHPGAFSNGIQCSTYVGGWR